MGGVALDFMDTGRRTYDFARPLYRREAPIGRFERARLVRAAGAQELILTLLRQLRTPDFEKIATTLADAPMLVQYLDHAGVLADPTIYHEAPRVPDLEWRSRASAGRRFEHVTFRSPYAPGASVPGAARYAEQTGNEIAHAWMLRQQSPAPWVVCVHGAGMGDPMVDPTLFRAAALRRRSELHAVRRTVLGGDRRHDRGPDRRGGRPSRSGVGRVARDVPPHNRGVRPRMS